MSQAGKKTNMFKKLLDFLNALPTYFNGVANNRTNTGDQTARPWFVQSIGYTPNLLLKSLQTVTDRSSLNSQVASRLLVSDVNQKQGVHALRIEIAQLYSFQKCFVARHKTRLQYYRDDLAQKGYRNLYAIQLSYDNFTNLQTNCEQQSQ